MTSYLYSKIIDSDKLVQEITDASLPGFLSINTIGDRTTLYFSSSLIPEHEDILEEILSSHSVLDPDPEQIFIGEEVLDGVVNAPLRTDSNGLLASGLVNSNTTATDTITRSSNTFADVGSLTATPGTGTYLVLVNMDSQVVNDGSGEFVLNVAGSDVTATTRTLFGDAVTLLGANVDIRASICLQHIATVGASDVIKVRYRSVNNTVTVRNRSMILLRIA